MGRAHVLRPHDFVAPAILQHPVLVNAGFVREGVPANNGLVGLHSFAGQLCQELARGEQLLRSNAGGHRKEVGADPCGHHQFFE